jgi:3-oxoacyl-[acyl-carrier-protein] synthase III
VPEAVTAPDAAGLAPAPATYGAALTHLGVALPERRVSNEEIAQRAGVDTDWIVSRTGIHERRAVSPGETLAGLAAQAGQALLEDAGLDPADLDLVLVATTSADHVTPSAAPLVATAIGATRAGAIDVGAACTGFLSGLMMGAAQIESGRAERVLLIGADILTRYTDYDDRRTAALFGDGAGATLLTQVPSPGGVGTVVLGADGSHLDTLFASRERGVIEMDGPEVFRHAVNRMTEATLAACERSGLPLEEVDLFVYHQANARILRAVGQRLDLDPAKVIDCIGPHGNTSAASIPIALEVARRDGRLFDGARMVMSAFGAGFTWGGAVVEWGRTS